MIPLTITTPTPASQRFSLPGLLLRGEGLALLAAALSLYAVQGYNWLALVLLLLAPDLGMLGYLINQRVGSITYNLVHTTSLPLLMGLASFLAGVDLGLQLALIWAAHIGMDRSIGYGLKYVTGFKDTHLARV